MKRIEINEGRHRAVIKRDFVEIYEPGEKGAKAADVRPPPPPPLKPQKK